MSPNASRIPVADMELRVDVIADTLWAAEGLAAALQRGARAAATSGAVLPSIVMVRPMALDRWLAGWPALSDKVPELIVVLLQDISSGAHMLQRLPADIPVLWLYPAAKTAALNDVAPDRPVGVLPADATDAQLVAAVSALVQGLSVSLPAAFHAQHTVVPLTPAEALAEPLTARELEVLELMAKGLANREIADALGISRHTAKFHVAQILDKTGSATRTEAVRQGLRLGLIGL